jgi:hypothetical protein
VTSPHAGAVGDARQQPVDLQRLRPYPVERAQPSAEDVVVAAVAAGALDRAHVPRLLHHAHQRRVAARVAADGARILIAEIAAGRALDHAGAHLANRLGEPLGRVRRLLQQVKREPLRRLPADPGELGQLRDEILDRGHCRLTAAAGTGAATRR